MKISVRAHELTSVLDRAPANVRTLSLDCFDTLLWRNANAPVDVFADLPIEGGSIETRMKAEAAARKAEQFASRKTEVNLEAIYRQLLPAKTTDAAIAQAIEEELAAEARHCFGFAPVIQLIRDAKARGWQVIIVSDTYLNADQLRDLIGRAAGADIAEAIDRVFASSDYGVSKANGLFNPVLADLGIPAASILHIGDNQKADQTAPSKLGICTVHFEQFDPEATDRLRMEAVASVMLEGDTRCSHPAYQPHRPLVSLRDNDDPVWRMGHDVVGPLMHSFAHWLRNEAQDLAAHYGRPVKMLFVMRDGYLPMKIFETLNTTLPVSSVAISRLTAGHASFVNVEVLRDFAITEARKHRLDVFAGLLLLSEKEVHRMVGPKGTPTDLARAVLAGPKKDEIVRRSASHADRLIEHVRQAGVEAGDTVMLCDLGYNGTVQNRIDAILRDRLGVEVAGRYLLLREQEMSGLDKRGFLDSSNYDRGALQAFCSSIAVIEQLSTIAQGSVRGYTHDGTALYEAAREKGIQSDTRDLVQSAAISFAEEAERWGADRAVSDTPIARRRMAAAILARFLFLPMADEVGVLESFDHDVNLGSDDMMKLVDTGGSAKALRRSGLPYVRSIARMYLPGELQARGFPLNLSLFSISRFQLDLRLSDFQVGAVRVPVLLVDAHSHMLIDIEAFPTHDGFYAMAIPTKTGLSIGVQLGMACEIAQIEDVSFHTVEMQGDEIDMREPPQAQSIADGMEQLAAGLFRCSPESVLFVPPPVVSGDEPQMLRVVFRPVMLRNEVEAVRQAA